MTNVSLKKKILKSYYKSKKTNMRSNMIFYVIIILVILGIAINEKQKYFHLFFVIGIYLTFLLYYFRLFNFMHKKIIDAIYTSAHTSNCIENYKKLLNSILFMIFFIVLYYVMSNYFKHQINMSEIISLSLIGFIGISGALLMNYNFIYCFYDEGFFVGENYISYLGIDEIISYKEVDTYNGKLIYCIFKKQGKEVGFDKLLVEEYLFLHKKIYELVSSKKK